MSKIPRIYPVRPDLMEQIKENIRYATETTFIHDVPVVYNSNASLLETPVQPVEDYLNELEDLEKSDVKFRFQQQKAMFTYKTHVNKVNYREWFSKKTRIVPRFLEIAHETGDDACPYHHSHVLVDFGVNFQTTKVRFFDYEDIHPNIKKVKSQLHWLRSVNYLSKEDPELAHLKCELNIVDKVQAESDIGRMISENITTKADLKYVVPMMQIHALRKFEPPIYDGPPICRWQIQLKKIIEEPWVPRGIRPNGYNSDDEGLDDGLPFVPPHNSHGRDIIMIYNPEGARGKSTFGKYMSAKDPKRFMHLPGLGQTRDISLVIDDYIQKFSWTGEVSIVDITRDDSDKKIYDCLERIIDGNMVSTKYKGKIVTFKSKLVVVLTNKMLNLRKLSMDRWKIYTISQSWYLADVSLRDAITIFDQQQEQQFRAFNPPQTTTFEGLLPTGRR